MPNNKACPLKKMFLVHNTKCFFLLRHFFPKVGSHWFTVRYLN